MNAVERVELSRARLRNAMTPVPALPDAEPTSGAMVWLQRLKAQPAIGIVIETLQGWWSRHPLRALVQVASEATNALAKPVAQHNPIALVVIAGLAGALLAWSRPWRWALRSAIFAGLMPQLISRVAANVPLESWLAVLSSTLSGTKPQAEPPRSFP